ncbi:transposase [Streptococcus pneumoniae]|nr:transposase [Streptococcus pneumoniae]
MGKSYKEIIELLDCNQTMIWRNVKKYEEFGLDSLLQETRGGRNHAYMTVEEEKAFLARHLKAAEAGEFVTIDALFQAYKKELGRSYTRDAFYQLLKRHGWRNVKKYEEFGLDSLLQETRGGRNHAYMTVEEEKAFLARHLKAAEADSTNLLPLARILSCQILERYQFCSSKHRLRDLQHSSIGRGCFDSKPLHRNVEKSSCYRC